MSEALLRLHIDKLERELAEARALLFSAYEGMRCEAMRCPWCSGYISAHQEEHDQFCKWPAIAQSQPESESHRKS